MARIAPLPFLLVSLILLFAPAATVLAKPMVLFDQGHGQLFLIERDGDFDLSRLAGVFRESGHNVTAAATPLTADLLAGIDALVLSGPFAPYTPQEIETIASFVGRGGALCIMLHIAPPFAPLLQRFGVEHSNGVIREQEGIIDNDPVNFQATRLADHRLFQGVRQFNLYGVWALHETRPDVQVIARTSPSAWIDLNRNGRLDLADAQQSFAVAVAGRSGSGRFVVFGDDAIFQNKFLIGDNLILGRNLAAWLAADVPLPAAPSR